jgi:hypothetical protein
VGAAGVVAQASADGGAVGRGGVDAVLQADPGSGLVELGQDDTRLHPCPAFFALDLEDARHARREVHDDGVVHRLPGQAGAAAAGQDGYAGGRGHVQDVLDVRGRARNDDGNRFHLVDGGVGGVEEAVCASNADLALEAGAQTSGEFGDVGSCEVMGAPGGVGEGKGLHRKQSYQLHMASYKRLLLRRKSRGGHRDVELNVRRTPTKETLSI